MKKPTGGSWSPMLEESRGNVPSRAVFSGSILHCGAGRCDRDRAPLVIPGAPSGGDRSGGGCARFMAECPCWRKEGMSGCWFCNPLFWASMILVGGAIVEVLPVSGVWGSEATTENTGCACAARAWGGRSCWSVLLLASWNPTVKSFVGTLSPLSICADTADSRTTSSGWSSCETLKSASSNSSPGRISTRRRVSLWIAYFRTRHQALQLKLYYTLVTTGSRIPAFLQIFEVPLGFVVSVVGSHSLFMGAFSWYVSASDSFLRGT